MTAVDEDAIAEIERISARLAVIARSAGTPSSASARPRMTPQRDCAAIPTILAKRYLKRRRERSAMFPDAVFDDPEWDMLLDLFLAEREGRRVSVSSLCLASAVAPTTALRHIGRMERARLLVREPDLNDGRRTFVRLADGYAARVEEWLLATWPD